MGGNNSNAYISIIQMFIALACSIGVGVFAVSLCGGLVEMNVSLASINPEFVQFGTSGYPIRNALSIFLLYFLSYFGNPGCISKFFGLKDKRMAPKCTLI